MDLDFDVLTIKKNPWTKEQLYKREKERKRWRRDEILEDTFRRERNLMSRYYERILLLNLFISDRVARSFNLSFAPSAFPKELYSFIHHPDILYYAFAHFILRFIVAENIIRREWFCFSPVTRASIFSNEMKLKRTRMAYLKPRLLVRTHRQLLDLAFITWFIAAFTRRVSTEDVKNKLISLYMVKSRNIMRINCLAKLLVDAQIQYRQKTRIGGSQYAWIIRA